MNTEFAFFKRKIIGPKFWSGNRLSMSTIVYQIAWLPGASLLDPTRGPKRAAAPGLHNVAFQSLRARGLRCPCTASNSRIHKCVFAIPPISNRDLHPRPEKEK